MKQAGQRGPRGHRGERGRSGARGPVGPSVSKTDILAAVDEQFTEVHRRLETQLARMAQLQQQIDLQHKDISDTRRELEAIHGVLKRLIASNTHP